MAKVQIGVKRLTIMRGASGRRHRHETRLLSRGYATQKLTLISLLSK